ncbi:cell wall hydrolase [Beijerinckiaceae bacterium]|nr:cell wall hydrolase [Beijerinckiaceae bacterium]
MAGSRIGWAAGAVAPWCLGMALAVSISADAGQEASSGASLAPLSLRAQAAPALLVPPSIVSLGIDFNMFSGKARKLLREASLSIGDDDEFKRLPDEIEPRADVKHNAQIFPSVDRSHKGDPFVGLRPTFDSKLRELGGVAYLRAHDLIFHHDETGPTGGFAFLDGDVAGPDSVASFESWPDGESPTTAHSIADASPRPESTPMTMRPAAVNERQIQGATPATRRAVGLGSTTPAPADSTPIEVVALPSGRGLSAPAMSEAPASEARPNYAALVDQDTSAREKRCLAQAIYFEARSESEEGQAAVAQVVLNRVSSGLYPASICGVVFQNRRRYHACQFSFACEGRSLRVADQDAWQRAVRIADEVSNGQTYVSDIGNSTHYHANYVRPRWARRLEKMDVIGHHIFYKLRPGQT